MLAAGASSRMGRAKALLPHPDGQPLAAAQAGKLRAAGAEEVVIVLGHHADAVAEPLRGFEYRIVFNANWATGRLSSLQAGITAVQDAYGTLVLPVDAAGVSVDTLSRILKTADLEHATAVRPYRRGEPGKVLWLSRRLFPELLEHPNDPAFRLDAWIGPHETRLELDDEEMLINVNTPEAWDRFVRRST